MARLTRTQIAAAKANDLSGLTAVIQETGRYVTRKAHQYAACEGGTNRALVDDLVQTGRVVVWESLKRCHDDAPEAFFSYIDTALHRAMSDLRRAEFRAGVSERAAKDFENALSRAGGDPLKAEKLAASEEMGDRRMSTEQAYAARISWQGPAWLDAVIGHDDEGNALTLGSDLRSALGLPEDLVEPRDVESHRRRVIREQVHSTLRLLSERQRYVVKASFGIPPVPCYRPGEDDEALAAHLGLTVVQVQQARTKGLSRFRTLYLAGAQQW
ncbi:sigma factor [Streptomyces huiliensis]|uniref:sigma factor n=1 Tax=Streptomyces huiliensis TaxID=2876027 RepID=UPI001CBDCC86|nr:sigma factor [Streptomyces huiliensis]MBZ4319552.1 hypothetical protein [Streptomyces huiliensis]